MICPNCGEPVQTRHLFCVVCGADLKDVTPEKAGVRLKQALTKPIAAKKAAKELWLPAALLFCSILRSYEDLYFDCEK